MSVLEALRKAIAEFLRSKDPYDVAVDTFVKELQKALLRADVNVKLVAQLSNNIRSRALRDRPPPYVSKEEWFVKVVYDELSQLFGGDVKPHVFPTKTPYVIMLVGVQGSGKTTTAAKIAYFYKKYGYRPCLICADTYRPGAYEQLYQLSRQIDVPFCGDAKTIDSIALARRCLENCIAQGANIIIVDTAGRHGYGEEEHLLQEMRELAKELNPDEVMLVLDASMGQKAYDLALRFHQATPLGSITVSKFDGTARGGGALSAIAATGARIKFVGVGEKVPELEVFDPRRFVARLLGLGDLPALIEKLKALDQSRELEKRFSHVISTGKLTLVDVYAQLQALKRLGPLSKILQLIPGLSLIQVDDKQLKLTEERIKKWLAAMDSMTYEELRNPGLIAKDKSRIIRIARGSGISVEEVKELLRYYELLTNVIKNVKRHRHVLRRMGIDLSEIEQEAKVEQGSKP